MRWRIRPLKLLAALALAVVTANAASAQKQGGTLRIYHRWKLIR
jgi:hypothetical protein